MRCVLIMPEMKLYIRDKRSPKPSSAAVSKVMSANKAKNTKPELLLRRLLWKNGVRGYRVNWKGLPGSPDICFTKSKVALFVNGCFWHRCPTCNLPLPKSNKEFWQKKFEANVNRDLKKLKMLNELDWQSLTIWECELKKNDSNLLIEDIKKLISTNGNKEK